MNKQAIKKFLCMNTIKAPTKNAPNQATDMRDMVAKAGLLRTRDGFLKYNTVGFGSAITGLYGYQPRFKTAPVTISAFNVSGEGNLAVGSPTYSSVPSTDAGADQSDINFGSTVTLDGSAGVRGVSCLWTQTSGTTVTLSDATAVSPTFTMPASDVTFSRKCTNFWGSDTDTVDVTVNKTYIPVSIKDDGSTSPLVRNGSSGQVVIEDDAWNNALSAWGSDAWQYTNLKQVLFVNQIRKHPLTGKYTSSITGRKAKVTVDLTTYDSNDYESANLVVKPSGTFPALGIGVYYNNDGWLENDYNFLEDVKSELGTDWTSTNLYGAIFTPERPEVGVSGEAKGYVAQHSGEEIQGFYIALIPKT